MNIEILMAELKRDEGIRLKPYKDSVGKLTIGVGRNLDDVGISLDEATALLRNDIASVTKALDASLPWWSGLDEVRQRVIANMAFNMGNKALLTFRQTLGHVQAGRYLEAAQGMLDSKWATQVGIGTEEKPGRALRLALMMRDGGDP